MSSPRLLILDFDGVIIESNEVKTQAFEFVFSHYPDYADEMMRFHHANVSVTRYVKFEHLRDLLGNKAEAGFVEQVARQFSDFVRKRMGQVPLVPGAQNFLELVSGQWPVYLASVTPEAELFDILRMRGLDGWFKGVYGCPPWNKPDAVRDVLACEGIAPDDALLVGDSAGDQRAARETGVRFIARDSGLAFTEPAPLKFADLNALSDYFKKEFLN